MLKCKICSKKLTGYKKKFCGEICYQQYKKNRAKRVYELRKKRYPERQCSVCEIMFFPIRLNVTACSRECSKIQGARKQKARILKMKTFKPARPFEERILNISKDVKTRCKRVKTAQFNESDTTKDAVLDYLKKGNTILKFPDSPRAKVPSVNMVNGHTVEAKIGFGHEYEIDEEMKMISEINTE